MRKTALLPRLPLFLLPIAGAVILTSCAGHNAGSSQSPPPPPSNPPVTPTTHVAVADTGDNRILIYDAPLSDSSSPVTVIGQAGFTAGTANAGGAETPSAATVYSPHGVTADASGDLWVADRGNCRVLEFKAPFSTGMSASLAIGQPDFVSGGNLGIWGCPYAASLASSMMESPVSVTFDDAGDLWVSDEAAGRITEYVPPFSTGMAASIVIGQPDMQSANPCNGADLGEHGPAVPPTAATLCTPEGITFDSKGDLWVADQANLRVLEFAPPFSTGMPASLVLGQPNATVFTGNATCFASATAFCGASALAFDAKGDLWVSDWGSNRVLEFVPPYTTGMAASLEIGQSNLANSGPYPGDPMDTPTGLAFDSKGDLIVTDEEGGSEVLVYAPPLSTAMNPTTIIDGGYGTCPANVCPGPNTVNEPWGVAVF